MAIGFEDEFDYLDDDSLNTQAVDAPLIKGSKDKEEEATKKELIEEKRQEEIKEKIKEKEEEKKDTKEYDSVIYVVKVTTNNEDKALGMIADKVLKRNVGIYAIARPHGLRGYILLESPDKENAEEAVYNLPYVKGILPQQISYDEIRQMLEPKASDIKIEKNDIVEIISEPFKNEKAKVIRLDKQNGEAVVSLLGAAVPIPVTVKLDNLRVIRREELEE
jgi:transcription termination/antitermination protein NusG